MVEGRFGTNWTFYSGDADQGLLYHRVKYAKQSVSIIIGNKVQNWPPGKNGYPEMEEVLEAPFQNFSGRINSWAKGPPRYRHFYHFTVRSKPWETNSIPENLSEAKHKKSSVRYWFYHLLQLSDDLEIFEDWDTERSRISDPPFGWQIPRESRYG